MDKPEMPPVEELDRPFDYHKPSEEQTKRIEVVREAFQTLYQALWDNTRPGSASGRYRALAKTDLEKAATMATKAIVFECDNKEQP